MNRTFYDRLNAHCVKRGVSMSQFVEAAAHDRMKSDSDYPQRFRLRPHHELCVERSEDHNVCPIAIPKAK
jgi:hypothetical protein